MSLSLRDPLTLPQASQQERQCRKKKPDRDTANQKWKPTKGVFLSLHILSVSALTLAQKYLLQRSCFESFLWKQDSNENTVYTVAEKPLPDPK